MKSYTDLEQSNKLVKILPIKSADMHYAIDIDFMGYERIPTVTEEDDHFKLFHLDIPCWSLTALLNVLPEIQGSKPMIALDDNYITYPHMSDLHIKADNLIDACVEMISKLHGLKLL